MGKCPRSCLRIPLRNTGVVMQLSSIRIWLHMTEAPESDAVRRYHFAGTQHGIGVFPPITVRPTDGIRGQLPFNTVDYTPLLRAVLTNLDRWVTRENRHRQAATHVSRMVRQYHRRRSLLPLPRSRSTVSTPECCRLSGWTMGLKPIWGERSSSRPLRAKPIPPLSRRSIQTAMKSLVYVSQT